MGFFAIAGTPDRRGAGSYENRIETLWERALPAIAGTPDRRAAGSYKNLIEPLVGAGSARD